jgi:hypothetical protein
MVIKWILALIMIIHGLIHTMGGLQELGGGKFRGLAGMSLVELPVPVRKFLGAMWLVVVAMFLITAVALVTGQPWWKELAIASVVVSQILIIVWWPYDKYGTLVNLLIGLGIYFL